MTNQQLNQTSGQIPGNQTEVMPAVLNLDDTLATELKDLLQLNLNGQNGYTAAATDLKNEDYKTLLAGYAQERGEHANALSELLRAHHYAPDKTGSLSGALHEGWMNLRAALSSSDISVFAECERADELALAAYQEVIGRTTTEPILEILRHQFTNIRTAYERVKALRGALEQSTR